MSYRNYFYGLIVFFVFLLLSCQEAEEIHSNKTVVLETIPKTVYKEEIKASLIDAYFHRLHKIGVFNGNVLVAQQGKIIFQKSYGYSDIRTREPLKLNSVFQLGSVSKQFTATAILQLYEKGLLSLQDTIQRFFPRFPYKNITIHELLCHRSGLLNYIYFCDSQPIDKTLPLSNTRVINCLIDSAPRPYYQPNVRFNYSNTGYLILASIVEKVSGMHFRDYMQKNVFEPLGMKNTYVYNYNFSYESPNVVKGYEYGRIEANHDFLDGVVGDKGVYSNLYDLYLWDQGLYKNIIISKDVLDLAFEPYGKKKNAKKNYGYGWRNYYLPDSTKIIYHAGWWHGYQSLLVRCEKDSSTIVVLKNKRNRTIIQQDKLLEILHMD